MLRGALATLFLDLHDLADRSPYEQALYDELTELMDRLPLLPGGEAVRVLAIRHAVDSDPQLTELFSLSPVGQPVGRLNCPNPDCPIARKKKP